ncbi:MAP kinase kinase kinase Byr2 [Paramuricea clavata]|uniref:MAP kinase kinase kinase Byr2 n=1 Tax=Paramuricea clavata TaxID=317549 RepID=A0A7D9L7G4_PARCT|nr:MAP kinase kinase kinase Byr2 [Paramuricea clavata]
MTVLDSNWNLGYSSENDEERYSYGYINPDTSIRKPVLGVMKWNEKGRTCKKVIVVEYMEFKDRKLVEQLQQLDCAQLVKVLHVNPFGPVKLEMISESFPEGNICDAMLCHPALRDNLKKYIPQTGSAVMYLHSKGIVHRNVKLENFLVCNQSTVYEWVTSGNVLGDPDPKQSSNSSIYSFLCSKCWEWKTNRRASIETVVVEINK